MNEEQLRSQLEGVTLHAADGTEIGVVLAVNVGDAEVSLRVSPSETIESDVHVWVIDDLPAGESADELRTWFEDAYEHDRGRWLGPLAQPEFTGDPTGVAEASPPGPGDIELDL